MEIVKTYQFKREERCKRCGRRLKNDESKLLGYGPSCYKKVMKEKLNKVVVRRLF